MEVLYDILDLPTLIVTTLRRRVIKTQILEVGPKRKNAYLKRGVIV